MQAEAALEKIRNLKEDLFSRLASSSRVMRVAQVSRIIGRRESALRASGSSTNSGVAAEVGGRRRRAKATTSPDVCGALWQSVVEECGQAIARWFGSLSGQALDEGCAYECRNHCTATVDIFGAVRGIVYENCAFDHDQTTRR